MAAFTAAFTDAFTDAAQGENIIVPVVPQHPDRFSDSSFSLPRELQTDKRAQHKYDNVKNPDENTSTEEHLNLKTSSPAISAPAALKQIPGVMFQSHGGAGDAPSIRMQAAPVFEPQFFLNGISLQGAENGSQNIMMVPTSLLQGVTVWPDSAPYWFSENSIGGAIDFSTLDDIPPLFRRRASFRTGSFGFWQVGGDIDDRVGSMGRVNTAFEYARSRENYPVFNNSNTPFNTSDDSVVLRQNNDFERYSVGLSGETTVFESLGKVRVHIIGGKEARGIPGAVETPSDARLSRSLFFLSLSSDRLFLESGVLSRWTLGATQDNAVRTSKIENGYSESSQKNGTLAWTVSVPHFLFPGKTAFSLNGEYFHSQNDTHLGNVQSETSVQTTGHAALSRSFVFLRKSGLNWSVDSSLGASVDSAATKKKCGNLLLGSACHSEISVTSPPVFSTHVGAQTQLGANVSAFVRLAQNARRPFLQERMGSVVGVLANSQLRPERSRKVSVGVSLPAAILSCYQASDADLIFYQQVNAQQMQAQNIDSVYLTGCQAQLSHKMWNSVSSLFSYQWTKSSVQSPNLSETKELPRTPKHLIQAALSVDNVLPISFVKNWKGSPATDLTWRSPVFLDGANFVELSLPVQWNIAFEIQSSREQSAENNILFALELENVLDDRAGTRSDSSGHSYTVEHVGYSGFPPPGRRYFLKVEWRV